MDATTQVQLEYDLACGAITRLVADANVPTLSQFAQYIDHRDINGSGFITVFDKDTPRMFAEALDGDVNQIGGSLDNVEPVGFVVMIEDGRLKWLEGFTYSGNEWPQFDTFELATSEDGS